MKKDFEQVRILIWDFDGTLYRPIPDLWHDVREAEYKTIMNHTGWTHEKTVEEFLKVYKVTVESATETAAVLSNITIAQAAVEMEAYFDRRDFVKRDEKLIELFNKLKNFRHFILANGVISRHKETLEVLGLSPDSFEEIVTSETVGFTKPNEAGFRYILAKTNLHPDVHMMIGDRESVDLAPAKKLGIKTCLVWSDKTSDVADVTLPTVYGLAPLLLQ